MRIPTKDKIQEAITLYGKQTVAEVIDIVLQSGPSGASQIFEDLSKEEHNNCVDFLYFKQEE